MRSGKSHTGSFLTAPKRWTTCCNGWGDLGNFFNISDANDRIYQKYFYIYLVNLKIIGFPIRPKGHSMLD